jgi:hypothetical protein
MAGTHRVRPELVLQDWAGGSHSLKTKTRNTGGKEKLEQHGRTLRAQAGAEKHRQQKSEYF